MLLSVSGSKLRVKLAATYGKHRLSDWPLSFTSWVWCPIPSVPFLLLLLRFHGIQKMLALLKDQFLPALLFDTPKKNTQKHTPTPKHPNTHTQKR